MKRTEVVERCGSFFDGVVSAIHSAPVRACVASFVLGLVVSKFFGLALTLVLLAAVLVSIVWYVAETDEEAELRTLSSEVSDEGPNTTVNGAAKGENSSKAEAR